MNTPLISPQQPVQKSYEPLLSESTKTEVEKVTSEKAQETLSSEQTSGFVFYKPWTWSMPTWVQKTSVQEEKEVQKQIVENKQDLDDPIPVDDSDDESQGGSLSDDSEGSEVLLTSLENDLNELKSELPTIEGSEQLVIPNSKKQPEKLSQIESKAVEPEVSTSFNQSNLLVTAEKTDQTSSSYVWSVLGSIGSAVQSATTYGLKIGGSVAIKAGGWGVQLAKAGGKKALNLYTGNYAKNLDKAKLMNEAQQRMVQAGADPAYIELSRFVNSLLLNADGIKKNLQAFSDNTTIDRQLLNDLIDVNIANGFANLAVQVKQHENSIPNFANQTTLVSILSLFSQKASDHVNKEKLDKIELKYRDYRQAHKALIKEIFPNLDNEPEIQKILKKWEKGPIGDQEFDSLFPRLAELSEEEADDLIKGGQEENIDLELGQPRLGDVLKHANQLAQSMKIEQSRHEELQSIFKLISDDIVTYMFPNKVDDIVIPKFGILNIPYVQNYVYGMLNRALTDFIQESYEPLENDLVRRQGWEKTLQSHIGQAKVESLIDAPSALLVGYGKSYIQSDPSAVELIEWALNTAVQEKKENQSQIQSEEVQSHSKEQIVNEISQEQLASWILESAQTVLHTEDPNLLNAGSFIKEILHNLTLALMAKGSELVIPKDQRVDENLFIKELTDRIIGKFKSLQAGETIPDKFWDDFVEDLPLPPALKSLILPKLKEKAKSLQDTLTESSPAIKEVQSLHATSIEKVKSYKGGEQLVSITQAVTDKIVDLALSKNIEFVSSSSLGNTIEELFSEFLPGVKIDDTLKEWFKRNISALGVKEGGKEVESVTLLKQGVQAVLMKALINTIESNFKDNSEDYAAQLLKNIYQAFQKAFPDFTSEEKEKIETALGIQGLIKGNDLKIAELQKMMASMPTDLEPAQLQLIQDFLQASKRMVRADNYIEELNAKNQAVFTKLNVNSSVVWDGAQLAKVRSAVAFRKTIQQQLMLEKETQHLTSELSALKILKIKLDDAVIQNAENSVLLEQSQKQLAHCETLIYLLELPKEKLKLVSEALTIEKTLDHALNEWEYISNDLEDKEKSLEDETKRKGLANPEAWKKATGWMVKVLDAHDSVNELKKENARLTDQLDPHLAMFQTLSHELSALFGLDQKEKLQLPTSIQDKIWPFIETAKQKHLARFLFEQVTPMLLPVMESEANRKKLVEIGKGDDFLAKLSEATAKGLVKKIPDYITSYRPFAKLIFVAAGVVNPTEEQIGHLEKALNRKMQNLGADLLTVDTLRPYLKGKLSDTDIDRLNLKLLQNIRNEGFSKENLIKFLSEELPELEQLNDKAHQLADELSHFLIQLGKTDLKTEVIIQAYEEAASYPLNEQQAKNLTQALNQQQVIQKIQQVQITPEKLAQLLNSAIPGASNLHDLIGPQLQAVISNNDPAFQANWSVVERYIEGMLLKVFVKIAEANEGENTLEVISGKLKDLIKDPAYIRGKTREQAAQLMIDDLLQNILDIRSASDVPGVPPAIQTMAYKALKEQAYLQLSPMLFPAIEKQINKERLRQASGSNMLGNLANALSKDAFSLVPSLFRSVRPIAAQIFQDLSGHEPTTEELNEFATKIAGLSKNASDQTLTNKLLVEAYLSTTALELDNEEQLKTELIRTLIAKGYREKVYHILEEALQVVMTPEQVADSLGQFLPQIDGTLQQTLADHLHKLTRNENPAYQNISAFASEYVEGMVVRLFMRIAEKNPPVYGKDTLVVLTENLLKAVERKYQEAKTQPDVKQTAQELNDEIFKEVLGFDSEQAFEGLPEPLKKVIYDSLKDQLGNFILTIHKSAKSLENNRMPVQDARRDLKKFGVDENTQRAYAEIVAEDLSSFVLQSIPKTLMESGPNGLRSVIQISKGIEDSLEGLANANFSVARVLLKYAKTPIFKEMLGDNLTKISDPDALVAEKEKTANLVSNLVLVSMNKVFTKAVDWEEKEGAQFNRKLMGNLLQVATNHIKTLNKAKQLAAAEGRSGIKHADFVKASGDKLHQAIPTKPITFDKSIEAINARLSFVLTKEQQELLRQELISLSKQEKTGDLILTNNLLLDKIQAIRGEPLSQARRRAFNKAQDGKSIKDVILEEAGAIHKQRHDYFYDPATKTLMKMLFPQGKKDLAFVPDKLRAPVWKALKNNIFPLAVQSITESILDEQTIKTVIASILKSSVNSLTGEIKLDNTKPEDPSLDSLDDVSGELMSAMIDVLELPAIVKNRLKDPVTGEVNPSVKKSLGASLRKQINGEFIENVLKSAIESAAQRDPLTNEPVIKFDGLSKAEKSAAREERIKELDKQIKQGTYDVVDASVVYFIRSTWKSSQAKFDALVDKAFGKIGTKLKRGLDAVFGYIFFKIIGAALSFLFTQSGLKDWLKKKFHNFLSLDTNRERILKVITDIPDDQPTDDKRAIYHEDLGYKLARVLRETVEDTLKGKHSKPVKTDDSTVSTDDSTVSEKISNP